jgi:hypothetical protein
MSNLEPFGWGSLYCGYLRLGQDWITMNTEDTPDGSRVEEIDR